jgi:hypothetical protein
MMCQPHISIYSILSTDCKAYCYPLDYAIITYVFGMCGLFPYHHVYIAVIEQVLTEGNDLMHMRVVESQIDSSTVY